MSLEEEKRLAADDGGRAHRAGHSRGARHRHDRRVPARGDRAVARSRRATWRRRPRPTDAAQSLGITVEPFDALDELDLAIDGADQIAPDGWLVKGRGGAHLREKIVAASARTLRGHRRLVEAGDGAARAGAPRTSSPSDCARRCASSVSVTVRDGAPRPDGGVLADYHGAFADPSDLADALVVDAGRQCPRPLRARLGE